MEFKQYRRKGLEMRPYVEGEDIRYIACGKIPKVGDMVARDPREPESLWIIAKEKFEYSYEEVNTDVTHLHKPTIDKCWTCKKFLERIRDYPNCGGCVDHNSYVPREVVTERTECDTCRNSQSSACEVCFNGSVYERK